MSMSKQKKNRTWLKTIPSPWFSTSEILEYLGISDQELVEQIELFTEGIHYKYQTPNEPGSPILWRADLIDELLCLPVPPLEKEALRNAINNHITCHN